MLVDSTKNGKKNVLSKDGERKDGKGAWKGRGQREGKGKE